jgi:hypothetical protein
VVVQERVVASSIGRALLGPKIQDDGSLVLHYVNGGMCIDVDNSTKPYMLTVDLHCNTDVMYLCLLVFLLTFLLENSLLNSLSFQVRQTNLQLDEQNLSIKWLPWNILTS